MDCNEISELCDAAERLFSQESSVLQIRAPVKIFGDLHGQFGDLMRLFDEYGSPSTAGDITWVPPIVLLSSQLLLASIEFVKPLHI